MCVSPPLFQAKASRESAAGKTGALRALLEASAPGGALHGAGVCGRLGDLGAIAANYDVAVRAYDTYTCVDIIELSVLEGRGS